MNFAAAWLSLWIVALILPWKFPRVRTTWLFPLAGIGLLFLFRDEEPPLRLLASSLFFLYIIKAAVASSVRPDLRPLDRLLYMTLWPGLDPERLSLRAAPHRETGRRFGRGLTITLLGIATLGGLALFFPAFSPTFVGWAGIAGFLLAIHFGVSNLLTALAWLTGRPVHPLFDRPLASESLSDFWTRRWNRPYVDMNRHLFMPLLRRFLPLRASVFGVFLVSGLLHEMAISYPAGGGWGGPLLYFAIQGVAVLLERRWRIRSRPLTWAIILIPLPLLFHETFRSQLIVPFFSWAHGLLIGRPLGWYVELILWSLPIMQLSVLMASYQVPRRLNWHEELARLSPFNRKLMWTYALFIVASVIGFSGLTLGLHASFMAGERAAIGLAGFMCGFWVLRLVFDTFYYSSADWPEGVQFEIGHALLNALFVYLTLGYGSVAVWGALQVR